MPETLPLLFAYVLIPVASIVIGGGLGTIRSLGARWISGFQHFAAGAVFAAVAVELVPRLHAVDQPIAMVVGFVAGVAAMLVSKRVFATAGTIVPNAVDLFIDGILIAVGFAAGAFGGMVLLAGLTLETLSLGLSTAPSLMKGGATRAKAVATLTAIGLMIVVGFAVGHAVAGVSSRLLAAILGFGVSALLYLVTEELLAEAHEVPDTPLVTATFFLGFLIPIVLASA